MLWVEEPDDLPPLHRAACQGDASAVRRLIARGAEVEARADAGAGAHGRGLTPLMVAAGSRAGSRAAVLTLLEQGANLRAFSRSGVTALWYAASSGDPARMALLLEAGGDPGETAQNGCSALCEAAGAGDAETVRLLLLAGASPEPRDGEAPAFGRPMDPWRELCDGEAGQAPAGSFSSFQIPLFRAAAAGSGECTRLLLDGGASAGLRDNLGDTALMSVTSAEAALALLEAGAELDARGAFGRTPLDHALESGRTEVVQALLRAGADRESRDRTGQTALIRFCRSANTRLSLIRLLLAAGADIRAIDAAGGTALHAAAMAGSGRPADLPRVLVEAGLTVDQQDEAGQTPLHRAVGEEGGGLPVVRALLALGAAVNAVDQSGRTPLTVAARFLGVHGPVTARALLEAGADPALSPAEGPSAVESAAHFLESCERHAAGSRNSFDTFLLTSEERSALEQAHQNALEGARALVALLDQAHPARREAACDGRSGR